jgi:hypothetical protein
MGQAATTALAAPTPKQAPAKTLVSITASMGKREQICHLFEGLTLEHKCVQEFVNAYTFGEPVF